MREIINSLKEKAEEYNIRFNSPVCDEQIINFEKNYSIIPSEYKDFIEISNGLWVTECYDCMIYSLQDVVDVLESTIKMQDSDIDKGILHIGTFWEDALYINHDNIIFLSFQGIEKAISINMSFRQFLEKCLEENFEIFWD